ncbi:MAG: hypothetical protein HC780_15590 [Leptolyngbyaceae cyanobacterium CSU_1_3]|nr:hypothetical protein [Leptolyngbyaceae cyanobacterium CSU_1_3]
MPQIVSQNGISVKAYAGTTGVMVAMNMTDSQRKDWLEFAIERINGRSGKKEWLTGMLPFFSSRQSRPGQPIPSHIAPIQRFRWFNTSDGFNSDGFKLTTVE